MDDSTGITGATLIARSLSAGGVDTVFGLPGVHNIALWPACADAGVRIVGSRHEQGCAYAADGYARTTGRVGVVLVTTGPGAANTLAAVGEAQTAHSPVVVIASDIATTLRTPGVYRGVLHECRDQTGLFAAVSKAVFVPPSNVAELGAIVTQALELAMTAPTGPVYVGVPTDLFSAVVAPDVLTAARTVVAPGTAVPGRPPGPTTPEAMPTNLAAPFPQAFARARPSSRVDPDELSQAVAIVTGSERPLIWVGGGARDAGAEVDVVARILGAPVIETFLARGTLPHGHPLLVGLPPHEPEVTALIGRADAVLVVGSDLDHMTTMGWTLPLPARRVAVNVDRDDAVKNYPMDVVVRGDSAEVLGALAGLLEPRVGPDGSWPPDLQALRDRVFREIYDDPATASAIRFLASVGGALAPDAVVFADMAVAGYWISAYHPVTRTRSLHYPMGWGTLGFAFPAAVGAAVTGASTVAIVGDGGMLFGLGELATVVQERLPLTVVVVDDGGYGMLRYGRDDGRHGTELHTPDFFTIARGFGVAAHRVDDVGEPFQAVLRDAVASREPALVHLRARLAPPRTTSPRWPRPSASPSVGASPGLSTSHGPDAV